MRLLKKPEIEPLDKETWAHIEGSLFEKLDRRERQEAPRAPRWRPAVAFALAGAAAVVVLGLGWQARSPMPNGGPSRIVTHGDGSHFEVSGAALDVSPDSALLVSGDDEHGMLVVLDRGSVTCEVTPRSGRPPFVVQAGDVTVKVVGTHFTVQRTGDSGAVQVDRGVVEVRARGEVALLRAGASWPLAPSPIPSASNVGEPAPNDVLPREPTPSARPPMIPTPPAPQELYEAATEFEARRPDRSIAIYRELAKGDGPWAANALFAEGRLESDRGHGAEARLLLSKYLKRFPRGANAEDARHLLERL